MKAAINDYKYRSVRDLAFDFKELYSAIYGDIWRDSVIVPMPTIAAHKRERGFDHTLYLAKRLGEVDCMLGRKTDFVQVGSSLEMRKIQANEAYFLRKKVEPTKRYILLDDVWTTGSSMKSAVRLFREAGANNVDIALLAKTA